MNEKEVNVGYSDAMSLEAVALATRVGRNILRQPQRRAKLGFIDSPRPSFCIDQRFVFITGSSVKNFVQNQNAMKNSNKFIAPPGDS